ncbi:1772_t:CDS:1, partial [Ambispora leptoticha]
STNKQYASTASQDAIDPKLLFLDSQQLSPQVIHTPNLQTHLLASPTNHTLALSQPSSMIPATIQHIITAE